MHLIGIFLIIFFPIQSCARYEFVRQITRKHIVAMLCWYWYQYKLILQNIVSGKEKCDIGYILTC
jgi:hypothetical protein